jgi:hypothetical protein
MKIKIGTIYNKPIVEGDINLKTPNEIHKSELSEGGGSSSNKFVPKYYSIKQDIPSEFREIVMYGSTIKVKYGNTLYINPTLLVQDTSTTLVGFSFNPIHTEINGTNMYIDSIEELLIIMRASESVLPYIQRITEEEYYTI